jgi:NADPH:quinone reductase-like Zn-dependent oxidoreductase
MGERLMKAMVYDRYGGPEVLELRDVDKPELVDDGVLVRVRAASVNPVDWHLMTGSPLLARLGAGLRKPKTGRLGTDFAGVVEAVGKDVTLFKPGDEVYGARSGACGEYVCVRKAIAPKPANLTFEEAAAVPVAAVTALQGLRKCELRAGQKVLVNGASGGVGTFAVQIAKALGAEVTGVCSTQKVELVRSIGADQVIDYTRDDFTRNGASYDVIFDGAGNRTWSETKRVLDDGGRLVIVGGPKDNRLYGPFGLAIGRRLLSMPGSRTVIAPFIAHLDRQILLDLNALLESEQVKPVIESEHDLLDVPEVLAYLAHGHARAKLVITVP